MHEYSSDSPDRKMVPFRLAALAVFLTYLTAIAKARLKIEIPWWSWVEAPSVAAFYWILYEFFGRVVWRTGFGGLRASKIRDLEGTWAGALESRHKRGELLPIVVWITQTWTQISVRAETEQSFSRSVAAAVLTADASEPGLTYQYLNEPKAMKRVDTMHPHRGTASFRFSSDKEELKGEYYTAGTRENHGAIVLRRVNRKELTRDAALGALAALGSAPLGKVENGT